MHVQGVMQKVYLLNHDYCICTVTCWEIGNGIRKWTWAFMEQVTIKTYVESQKGVNSLLMMVNVFLALSRTKNTRLIEQGFDQITCSIGRSYPIY